VPYSGHVRTRHFHAGLSLAPTLRLNSVRKRNRSP
jgi:hypothetical protein